MSLPGLRETRAHNGSHDLDLAPPFVQAIKKTLRESPRNRTLGQFLDSVERAELFWELDEDSGSEEARAEQVVSSKQTKDPHELRREELGKIPGWQLPGSYTQYLINQL